MLERVGRRAGGAGKTYTTKMPERVCVWRGALQEEVTTPPASLTPNLDPQGPLRSKTVATEDGEKTRLLQDREETVPPSKKKRGETIHG